MSATAAFEDLVAKADEKFSAFRAANVEWSIFEALHQLAAQDAEHRALRALPGAKTMLRHVADDADAHATLTALLTIALASIRLATGDPDAPYCGAMTRREAWLLLDGNPWSVWTARAVFSRTTPTGTDVMAHMASVTGHRMADDARRVAQAVTLIRIYAGRLSEEARIFVKSDPSAGGK